VKEDGVAKEGGAVKEDGAVKENGVAPGAAVAGLSTDSVNLVPNENDCVEVVPKDVGSVDLAPNRDDSMGFTPKDDCSVRFDPNENNPVDLAPEESVGLAPKEKPDDSAGLAPKEKPDDSTGLVPEENPNVSTVVNPADLLVSNALLSVVTFLNPDDSTVVLGLTVSGTIEVNPPLVAGALLTIATLRSILSHLILILSKCFSYCFHKVVKSAVGSVSSLFLTDSPNEWFRPRSCSS
jgi:hypothetical protein